MKTVNADISNPSLFSFGLKGENTMNLTNIKALSGVTAAGTRLLAKARLNGPTIGIIVGTGGLLAAMVLACKQTRKLDPAVEEAKKIVKEHVEDAKQMEQPKATQHKVKGYLTASWRVVKVYALPAGITIISVGAILYSLKVIDGRFTLLTGALTASQASEKRAWEALENEVGVEKANDIRYEMHNEDVATKVDEDGKVLEAETVKVDNDPDNPKRGKYAFIFEEVNIKDGFWEDDAWKNRKRLQQVEQDLNYLKDSRRTHHVFLEEALKAAGFRYYPKYAKSVGWIGDEPISLGLDKPWAKRFVNGEDPNVVLTPNCQGFILDKLAGNNLEW